MNRLTAQFERWGPPVRGLSRGVLCLVLLATGVGCQTAAPITSRRLIEHQAMIDFSGLKAADAVATQAVKAAGSVPTSWRAVPAHKTSLYTHLQWRSPSAHTAMGVIHIHLPLPLGGKAVTWLAKQEYARRASDGKVLAEWDDDLGRHWLEGENAKYHLRGYVITRGFDGWAVYLGYKITEPPEMSEISLASRATDTFVPGAKPATRPTSKPD